MQPVMIILSGLAYTAAAIGIAKVINTISLRGKKKKAAEKREEFMVIIIQEKAGLENECKRISGNTPCG
jgi:hypothetical protein